MQIFISVDMEGVAGVVHVDQTRRTGSDYDKARRWMTGEANAAIEGAFDAGATDVLVNDSHGDMRNLLLDELDERAEVISGSLKPLSMVQGAARDIAAALFVGYHAGAGTRAGVLDHTYYGRVVARCRVGGSDFDETALNATVCGELGFPVALVTGDASVCASARARLRSVETVVVKDAITRYAARAIHPARARREIRAGAKRAVERARAGELTPYRPAPPHRLEMDFVNSACADAAELVPSTVRVGGTTTAYDAPDAATLLQVIQAWTTLAGTTIV